MKFCDGITRRDSLKVGIMGGLGLSLSNFLRLSASEGNKKRTATADSVLFINLAGGVSHLDTLDMKPDAPQETQGEFKPISSAITGLQVCEHLPQFAKIANQFTLMRGIGHSAGAHPQGQSWISTGNRPTPALVYPSCGSVITKELAGKPYLPSYIAIPKTEWNAGYMGDAYAPFNTSIVPQPGKPFQVRGISLADGLTIEKVHKRKQLLKKLNTRFESEKKDHQLLEAFDKFGERALSMMTSKKAQSAFAVEEEPKSIRNLFTPDEFNQSVLLGCRLIEYGVRFVTVTYAGWDTHTKNFAGHKRLLKPLDNGLNGCLAMLKSKGLLKRTLVIVMGEFGRTPKINVNAGRDHYPRVNWSLMTGGGVQPGKLIGGTNKNGDAPDDDTQISPDDIAATLYNSLGIDPKTEYVTNSNRPTQLVPHGKVIKELFES